MECVLPERRYGLEDIGTVKDGVSLSSELLGLIMDVLTVCFVPRVAGLPVRCYVDATSGWRRYRLSVSITVRHHFVYSGHVASRWKFGTVAPKC